MEARLDPRAVVIGSIVDNAATFAMSFLALPLVAFEIAGLLATLVGGFIAARIARAAVLRHGAAVGAVALGIGVLSLVGPAGELPPWYTGPAFALVVPAGILGGLLARRGAS